MPNLEALSDNLNSNYPPQDQIAQQGDIYTGQQSHSIIGGTGNSNTLVNVIKDSPRTAEFRTLFKNIAPNALHNSTEVCDQPKCHPGTREAILLHVLEWASCLETKYPVKWLHGPAGAGKSSILRTIAQWLFEKGLLLGSFFFFRTSARRNTSIYVISTLAYQLALFMPRARQHIEQAIARDPNVFSLSLWDQALALIVSPLVATFYDPTFDARHYPRVFVIDGLDECSESQKQCQLLDILRRIVGSVPIPLAVLVASRPEHHIRSAFNFKSLNQCSSRLALDDSYDPDSDIQRYLIDSFDADHKSRPDEFPSHGRWPSAEVIDRLVAKSSGQFIYAATVVRFVCSRRHNPVKRLNIILGAIKAEQERPYEQLDTLYSTIFHNIEGGQLASVLRVLGLLLIPGLELPEHPKGYKHRSPAYLEYFLQLDMGDVRRFFFDLESLLTIRSNFEDIQFFHASLSDYLFDASRSDQFWLDEGLIYANIARHCILHLPTWRQIQKFFVAKTGFFLQKAASIPALGRAIENINLQNVISGSSNGELYGINFICPSILRIAEAKAAQEIFQMKLLSFQKIVASRIAVYSRNAALNAFLVVVVLAYNRPNSTIQQSPLVAYGLLESFSDREAEHTEGFGLGEYPTFAPIVWVLQTIFYDHNGTYFLDAAHYTDVATYILRQTSSEIRSRESRSEGVLEPTPSAHHMTVLTDTASLLFSKSVVRPDLIKETRKLLKSQHSQVSSEVLNAFQTYLSKGPAAGMKSPNVLLPGLSILRKFRSSSGPRGQRRG